jgi:hypothetical protein
MVKHQATSAMFRKSLTLPDPQSFLERNFVFRVNFH